MAILKSKQLAAFAAVLVVTNTLTAAIAITASKSDDSNNNKSSTIASKSSKLSPTTVVRQPSAYSNGSVAVTGLIVRSLDSYLIVGQEKQPGALKLDFSKTKLDPAQYVFGGKDDTMPTGSAATQTAGPVGQPKSTSDAKKNVKGVFTVTGKLSQDAKAQTFSLVVESVKQSE